MIFSTCLRFRENNIKPSISSKPDSKLRQFDCLYFLIFLPECVNNSDCPNEGLNYQCNSNVCECPSGFVLNGEDCEALPGIL